MKTSIEWLKNKVKLMVEHNGCEDLLAVLQHIEQAKEIHKQEIMDAYDKVSMLTAEQYYNQTFTNENKLIEEHNHICIYSKSMNQPYPRLCVHCKKPEIQKL
jgi:hypothetical protein